MSKAIVLSEFGDSSVLNYTEVETPVAGPGQVLVRMRATGVNFIEIYQRTGTYSIPLPHILGAEGMGTIEALGEGVNNLKVGQHIAFTDGIATYAQFTLVPADKALLIPEGMDDLTAAALPLQGMTAHYLSSSTFPLGPEHTALIHAGAGGVGLLLIQLAKLRGARVFTTVSDLQKAELAKAAGADEVLDYDEFDIRVRELTGGRGVDVVYDGVGKATFDRSLKSLAIRGMMVLFGGASGQVPDFDLQRLNSGGSLFITRPTLWNYLLTPEERQWRWSELTEAVVAGKLDVRIGATYPLAEAAKAHDDLAGRKTTGNFYYFPNAKAIMNKGEYQILHRQNTDYDKTLLSTEGVESVTLGEHTFTQVSPEALELLAYTAYKEINYYLRPAHLAQLRKILDDPEASGNDKYVALDLLKNANVASGGVLPMCQDTGTALVMAKRGHRILTDGRDAEYITNGIGKAYHDLNLRYSQMSPVTMWDEVNTGTNLPAEVDISLTKGDSYEFLFMAKGGGSANKTFLYQETKAVLEEQRLLEFLREKIASLGTAACPPYHLAITIGGTSADFAVKTAKLASTHYLDSLPTEGGKEGQAFRDLEFEQKVFELTKTIGFGAQFGGKYFCHDVRVVRLPRHGASLPIAIAVSCSADRQLLATINSEGVFIEELEHDPARFIPETGLEAIEEASPGVPIDLNQPMPEILKQLSECSIGTRVMLTGTIVVARDIAHARMRERLERGEGLPDYAKDHPIYYAGPAKTPEGLPTGSFGPTTAGRMDSYVEEFQKAGGSMVMLAKGNRSSVVTKACGTYGGFYLGSVGGPAARLAQDSIRSMEIIDYPELGMEAVYKIEVENFPAFVVVDDKGNDFFTMDQKKPLLLGPTRSV